MPGSNFTAPEDLVHLQPFRLAASAPPAVDVPPFFLVFPMVRGESLGEVVAQMRL